MEVKFLESFDGLIEKYTELLLGESNEELKEKVKVWALYNHISKTMPALTNHWGGSFPEEREVIKGLYAEIKKLNEEYRSQVKNNQNK
ncbi:DUF2573 family protein [Tepidibacillus fermentans]|uniref:Uncharacterized protein DUF2573 n=1 Tax=Tepidibacillus fermentans TaxID=1281767 RepID=A0A4V2USE0_9BACI|nr:DUF2573 family protein [Tepidibacillus fermentans]TCS81072.1 uncharacterized protein DUF2573 [Tepidibacillus fermentans]